MTELLAPAGSFEALKAALSNGADAIYLGGKSFSARAFADNFTIEEIGEAVRLAHFSHGKIYVTLNTLVADEEMADALDYSAQLFKAGVDAIIVQDMGLLSLLRQLLPEQPVHASTQMSIHNAPGCRFLRDMGVERVILARELSLEDMKLVKAETDMGLETFVHGALCVCTSVQCLFSSMVGGRSGNRGRCAQPCRMAYKLVNDAGEPIGSKIKGSYLLSPRDLIGFDRLAELYDVGMDSWKIEGRMKKPEYVATVTNVYREAINRLNKGEALPDKQESMRRLLQVFNRDHCPGYWLYNPGSALMSYARPNNRGVLAGRLQSAGRGFITMKLNQPLHPGDMLEIWASTANKQTLTVEDMKVDGRRVTEAFPGETVTLPYDSGRAGDRVFKIFDAPLMEAARSSMEQLPARPLHFSFTALLGQPFRLEAADDDGYRAACVSDYVVERAKKSVSDQESIRAQLTRLGGTGYCLGRLEGQLDDGVILPSSVLNKCRRQLTEDILAQREKGNVRHLDEISFAKAAAKATTMEKSSPVTKMRLSALVDTEEQALLAASRGISDIYLDMPGFSHRGPLDIPALAGSLRKKGASLIPYLPQVILPREEKAWRKRIGGWLDLGLDGIVINNPGQLRILQELGWDKPIFAGMGMNCFNSQTCRFLAENGVRRITLSPELTLDQLRTINTCEAEAEIFAQGALQVMVSEYCAAGALCGGRCHDEKGEQRCSSPCRGKQRFNLKDEKGFIFPLRFDASCRMHVFNSKEHCLLKDIPELQLAGIDRLLLDIRLYDRAKAARLLELYALAIKDRDSLEAARDRIGDVMRDYTKGHLYRGV